MIMKTPRDLTFQDLASAGKAASASAVREAQLAGVTPARLAGLEGNHLPVKAKVARAAQNGGHLAKVLTLGAHMCKWPIGDPSSDTFTFCGRRSVEDGPYCKEHVRIAQYPQVKRKALSIAVAGQLKDMSIKVRTRKGA
ncbi:MAG TPA: GcrA family cell cycle regulator [Caulobacteraceae bacterium]|nr:GcrA family cell cycle regulator [Caulobacteraceae bacterium]